MSSFVWLALQQQFIYIHKKRMKVEQTDPPDIDPQKLID
jgi:hypothetical protein